MNRHPVGVAALLATLALLSACGKVTEVPAPETAAAAEPEKKPLYYRNPMNPAITSPVPRKDVRPRTTRRCVTCS